MREILILLCLSLSVQCWATEPADTITEEWIRAHYDKREVKIMMRDGVRLHTVIYEPKNKQVRHPSIMTRSCYSSAPYGEGRFMGLHRPAWREFSRNEYIFIFQDVRGKNMSEGKFEDIRPFVENKRRPRFDRNGVVKAKAGTPIDEASDTYDTAEWLVHNTHSNGNIGVFGISYPGFYSTMASLSGHPAIKAVSPQAPVTDWFRGDDAHHNGAFFLMDMFSFQFWFEYLNTPQFHNGEMFDAPKRPSDIVRTDAYDSYLRIGAFKNFSRLLGDSVQGWNDCANHPDLDDWWEERNVLYHCRDIRPAVMVVGGLFDAEDCYGAWATYNQIKRTSPQTELYLVEGPWAHGMWGRGAESFFGDIFMGDSVASDYYLRHIEYPFFAYYLEGKGAKPQALAQVFHTGENRWHYYADGWTDASPKTPFPLGFAQYVSDPAHPVPFTAEPVRGRRAEDMLADQRFASTRPDVAVFTSDVLTRPLRLAGEVEADLEVSLSTTDADFIVKVIDVFPDDFSYPDSIERRRTSDVNMAGYQMLVRWEVMRGKYRNSLSRPEPFVPGQRTKVKFSLPALAHTFMPGHKLMVQVQSTCFPLIDRNPQRFCNIYTCDDTDFQPTTVTIYPESKLWLPTIE